jgi:tRNA (mo5U34)-methyltransferase
LDWYFLFCRPIFPIPPGEAKPEFCQQVALAGRERIGCVTALRLTPEEIRRRSEEIRWYQTIDLGSGVITRGEDNTPVRLQRIDLPARLDGKSVLDIGAWDGFFSFEAERRGAARVLATDYFSWNHGGWGTKEGFEFARSVTGSRVEDLEIDVPDISPATVGQFDVVLFLGVLYHLREPFRALERVAAVTRQLLIVETVVDLLNVGRPAMAFYPTTELNGDPTNWWAPNIACLTQMLRACGFRKVRCAYRHSVPKRIAYAALQRAQGKAGFLSTLSQGRATMHASR